MFHFLTNKLGKPLAPSNVMATFMSMDSPCEVFSKNSGHFLLTDSLRSWWFCSRRVKCSAASSPFLSQLCHSPSPKKKRRRRVVDNKMECPHPPSQPPYSSLPRSHFYMTLHLLGKVILHFRNNMTSWKSYLSFLRQHDFY